MARISIRRTSAILFFLLFVVGAVFSLQRLSEDISAGKYFTQHQEFYQEVILLGSYILIILFVLRYGFYLAIDRVDWTTIRKDFLYLLNKRHFSRTQWLLNVVLFWLSLVGFIYSLAISAMKGNL